MKSFKAYITEARAPQVQQIRSKSEWNKRSANFVDLSNVKDQKEALRLIQKASLLLQSAQSYSLNQSAKNKDMVNRSIHPKLLKLGAELLLFLPFLLRPHS